MSESLVLTERNGPVAVVAMNRPDRLNALNDELIGLVIDALEEADRDEDVRAIVLAGGEKAFAAGADIGQMATATPMEMYAARGRIEAPGGWSMPSRLFGICLSSIRYVFSRCSI